MILRLVTLALLLTGCAEIATAGPSGPDRRFLEQTLAGTQDEIERARRQIEGTSQEDSLAPSLDLAEQALTLVRGMALDGNDDASRPDPRRLLEFLDQAQARIDELKSKLGDTPDGDMMRQQLELSEQRLDQARQTLMARHYSSRRSSAPQLDVEAIYARTQRRLDHARLQAKTLPNAEDLLKQLDEAQRRLDAARANAADMPAGVRVAD